MSTPYQKIQAELKAATRKWLVTGVAGFIGSNLLEKLLKLEQNVVGLDDFSTGKRKNLDEVKAAVSAAQWERFRFMEGDIANPQACQKVCEGADFVLHQAALGSVPASMADPARCHRVNVTGFLNMLTVARDAGVRSFVYASSSAVYGDDEDMPKTEGKIGVPLSPYAASKWMNEIYAGVFARAYGVRSIGLRYFNVFGPRQDPDGAYAAVIPKWIGALIKNSPVRINGDGETSRDFSFIENVVQANLLAATAKNAEAMNQVYNIAVGEQTTLNQLFEFLRAGLKRRDPSVVDSQPVYGEFRPGDVRYSVADISKAERLLGYAPTRGIRDGLEIAMDWYCENLRG